MPAALVKALFGLVCIGALALTFLVAELRGTERVPTSQPVVEPVSPATAPVPEVVPERASVASAPPAPEEPEKPSLKETLEEFWGARWPEQEAKMRAAGIDLDQPYEFTPWEEVAAEFEPHLLMSESDRNGRIQTLLEWPKDPTSESLGHALSTRVPEEDVEAVVQLAEPYNDRIRELGDVWARALERHVLDDWAAGRYQKAPFSTIGLEDRPGAFHVQSLAGRGWTAVVTLTEDDCPDMTMLRDEIRGLREERRVAALAYLRR